jgi:hypothetical protein
MSMKKKDASEAYLEAYVDVFMEERGDAESFAPPSSVRAAARRGLELRKKHGKGGLSTQEAGKQGIGSGVARATTLASGKKVSYAMIKRMAAFFSRHEKNKSGGRMMQDSSVTCCGAEVQVGRGPIASLAWSKAATRKMTEYTRVVEEEEDGIGIMKALAILSAHEHRETSLWRLVEEQHFKTGVLMKPTCLWKAPTKSRMTTLNQPRCCFLKRKPLPRAM